MTSLTELQDDEKLTRLKDILRDYGSLLVAFSGGVDSSFLLKAAVDFLGVRKVMAVTRLGPIFPDRETEEARKLAREIDADWRVIESDNLEDESFRSNPHDRCYYCKRALFETLRSIAEEGDIAEVADGSIRDDRSGHRPGRRAGAELGIKRPLEEAGLTKEEVRELSKKAGLPTWNNPSNTCLATRIPFGAEITEDKLEQINRAENALRELGFSNFRVRHHGDLARLELLPDDLRAGFGKRTEIVNRLKAEGYNYVALDLEGYREGSLSETVD